MNRNSRICMLAIVLAALVGCSSAPSTNEAKKNARPLDTIQGKAQVLEEQGGSADAALNAGGTSSMYLWVGVQRYRLFLRKAADITHGTEYVAEGIYAQKAIDEIGDPDGGKHGYPLADSCERVIRMIWSGMAMDDISLDATALRSTIQRHPANPIFLVTKIRPATSADIAPGSTEPKKVPVADLKNLQEVTVDADKQKASLIEGQTTLVAPLWQPEGGTVKCKVVIDQEGKISDLQTGAQLCVAVPWASFKYQPPVQKGHPVKVDTEVEIHYEARK